MGIVLGGISLLAGIYFLHVLVTARREMETSQNAGFKQE
jgi:hypothetical protein